MTGALTQSDLQMFRGVLQRGFRGYSLLAPFLDLEARIIKLFRRSTK
jgi:hypothetical protein